MTKEKKSKESLLRDDSLVNPSQIPQSDLYQYNYHLTKKIIKFEKEYDIEFLNQITFEEEQEEEEKTPNKKVLATSVDNLYQNTYGKTHNESDSVDNTATINNDISCNLL